MQHAYVLPHGPPPLMCCRELPRFVRVDRYQVFDFTGASRTVAVFDRSTELLGDNNFVEFIKVPASYADTPIEELRSLVASNPEATLVPEGKDAVELLGKVRCLPVAACWGTCRGSWSCALAELRGTRGPSTRASTRDANPRHTTRKLRR